MKAYWWKASLCFVALSGFALAQSDAPSLTDVARQTRKGKKKATIVLSDEDPRFARSTTPSTSAAPPPVVVSAQSASAAASSKSDGAKSATPAELKGASAATSAKQKLEFYKSELESWKGITRRDEESLAKETVPFRQQMYQDALDGDRQTTAFFQQKLDEVQNEMNKSQKESASGSGGK